MHTAGVAGLKAEPTLAIALIESMAKAEPNYRTLSKSHDLGIKWVDCTCDSTYVRFVIIRAGSSQ